MITQRYFNFNYDTTLNQVPFDDYY